MNNGFGVDDYDDPVQLPVCDAIDCNQKKSCVSYEGCHFCHGLVGHEGDHVCGAGDYTWPQ